MAELAQDTNSDVSRGKPHGGFLSTLGLAAAVAALIGASCCALPLLLASVGLAGAWIANLGVFVAYRPYITASALVVISLGWVLAFRRRPSRRVLVVLGCATALVLVALAVAEYEPQITRYLVSLRRK